MTRRITLLAGIACASLVAQLTGCAALVLRRQLPILEQEQWPGVDTSDCRREPDLLPYLCGLVPGQDEDSDVAVRMGAPSERRRGEADEWTGIPGSEGADVVWQVSVTEVFFSREGVVIGYWWGPDSDALTMHQVISELGPPTLVMFATAEDFSPEGWEVDRVNNFFLLWPERGIVIGSGLYGTRGIGANEPIPPLSGNLSIWNVWVFEPCSLEELEAIYESNPWIQYTRWADWSGLE